MTEQNQIQLGHLLLRERRSEIGSCAVSSFLYIYCASWEDRSLQILEAIGANAERLLRIEFSPPSATHADSEPASAIVANAKRKKRFKTINLGRSTDFSNNVVRLAREIGPIKPSELLPIVDITSMPKYIIVSLTALLLNLGVAAIRYCYSEGSYGAALPKAAVEALAQPRTADPLGGFTQGKWIRQRIPFFEGDTSCREGRRLFVFCGSDQDQIASVLDDYEQMNRFAIICRENDSISEARANSLHDAIVAQKVLDKESIMFCDPFSAVELVAKMENVPRLGECDDVMMPFSTKPHSLSAAVRGLFHGRCSVVCRVPEAYLPRQIGRAKRIFAYDLFDLSSPAVHRQMAIL